MTWIKKKIGPGIYNITTLDEAERVLTSETKVVLGYLNSLVVWFLFVCLFFEVARAVNCCCCARILSLFMTQYRFILVILTGFGE